MLGGMDMRIGHAVIGCNYGDEGKGLITDYLASQDPDRSLVVRFNGGAQAGHTVARSDGRRHIFSHFGAGSFVGCPTVLSRFFIVNPISFVREHRELVRLGVRPSVIIHGDSLLTTPFDMLINRIAETRRGDARHGSCGLGINETVTRCLWENRRYETRSIELLDKGKLFERLLQVGKEWLPTRLGELGVDLNTPEVLGFTDNIDQILHQFILDIGELLQSATISFDYPHRPNIIFEGAQGLMLDEDRVELWPHVTRSRTGIANVLALLSEFDIDHLEVTYVTRSYLTRHGAGPLPGECSMSFPDKTNVSNQFQGSLRFAPLDWNVLNSSVARDLKDHFRHSSTSLEANLAITCLDQLEIEAADSLLPVRYLSYGPTRQDVLAPNVNCESARPLALIT